MAGPVLPRRLARIAERARDRRWAMLAERFPGLEEMTVVDLGGTVRSWTAGAAPRPARLVILNVLPDRGEAPPWIEYRQGDACDPPADMGSFDLVYSNSVIEHVGGRWRRERFADVVHALGPSHWVQTPHRLFPLEAHYMIPGAQWMPPPVVARASMAWRYGNRHPADRDTALRAALALELVSTSEFRLLFPASEIVVERLAGFPKSLVAVLGPRS